MTFLRKNIVGCLPLLLVAACNLSRGSEAEEPPFQFMQNMGSQFKMKPQRASAEVFTDGSSMRTPPAGSVAIEDAVGPASAYDHAHHGDTKGHVPLPLTAAHMARGQERYQIYCAPCHGIAGDGHGSVPQKVERSGQSFTVPSLHDPQVREKPDSHYLDVIAKGYSRMPSYGLQIGPADRENIVRYVRALQRSQNTPVDSVPETTKRLLP